jgi:hypothetical protein
LRSLLAVRYCIDTVFRVSATLSHKEGVVLFYIFTSEILNTPIMQIEERLPDSPVINADQFKGIFIPGDILYAKDLTPQEKFLLALIWWLDGAPHHCYASNKYLAKHMNLSEKSIANMLVFLKEKGHIQQISWDGKIRVMKCTNKIAW